MELDSLTSKREPIVIGPDMESLKLCIVSDIPKVPEAGFNSLVRDGSQNKVEARYGMGRTVFIERINNKEAFTFIDKSFARNKFVGKRVVWSEHIADAFARKSILEWAQGVVKAEGELRVMVPIMPLAGIFTIIHVDNDGDYDDVFVVRGAGMDDVFLESFVTGTWTFQDIVVAYRDWFLGEYRNTDEFHVAYKEPDLEARYDNSNQKLPAFVQKWYKAIYGQSLTLWEVMPRQDEIPF